MNDWLARAAVKHPERLALELDGFSLTYGTLFELATRSGQKLAGSSYVGIDGDEPVTFAISLHACLLQSVPVVPLDPRLTVAERDARMRARGPTENVATVMFTSGTTSAPKPVGLTTANWLANALGSAVALGLDSGERWLAPMPLAHVGGLSILIRSTIYATTVVLHGHFEVGAVLEELMSPERRITLVSLVPTMLSRLLDAGLREPPTLRWALLGGGPIAPALLERAAAAGVPVAPTYGMTEACSQIATFGLPLHGVELELAQDGEIRVRGAVVAPGSIGLDGWLHTGDLGRFDDGRLVIIGRKADTIVTGGENVAPAEVEAALLEHPDVEDAGVFARPDPEWGEAVVATVVVKPGRVGLSADALRAFVRDRIAAYKVPKAIEFSDSLPRTPSGKLLRRELH